jgi:uncharacterized protein (TIGR03000 family)
MPSVSLAQVSGDTAGYAFGRYAVNTIPDPPRAFPDATGRTDWHSPYFHGYLAYDVSPHSPPTYLTSINYPLVYGGYIYPFPMGSLMFGARPRPFSSAPIVYGDYYTRTTLTTGMSSAALSTSLPPTLTTNSAVLNVRVPASDAVVTLNGVRMYETGLGRTFTVPNLIPTTMYTYDITASWPEGSRQVTKARTVNFQAGDSITIDFLREPGSAGTAVLRSQPLSD